MSKREKDPINVIVPFWLVGLILLAAFGLGVLVHKAITDPTIVRLAEVVQETPLSLETENGKQYQFLELSGDKENQYAIYLNPLNNSVYKVVQLERVIFER